MGRSRRCAFPLPENQDGSHFVGDIDLPADYDYDSVENCRRVASWLWLAESMMKQREDTLCRGDSVPPVGSTDDIDLGVSEQIFGEPKPQETGSVQKNKRKRRAQEPVGVQSRKRPRCGIFIQGWGGHGGFARVLEVVEVVEVVGVLEDLEVMKVVEVVEVVNAGGCEGGEGTRI
ncbi:hypothetical protein EMCG_05080 [[Emmonsia] crescens]|uniref:Uncharacterized protein n=1 Tax=[Emmonsia] crescens TaxID=73230 RepID=A0A0G2HQ81_9EURO|nr:hypothetical protein EMCG_05080 [Emmonsia crescens UAMH 3008]